MNAPPPPPHPLIFFDSKIMPARCRRIHGAKFSGVCISDSHAPRLFDNELWDNGRGGIRVFGGGDPYLCGNTIRDHAGARGRGVFVHHTSHGCATVLPDNVFLRNEGGDVVRQPVPVPPPDED